jgi:hypothetical protein
MDDATMRDREFDAAKKRNQELTNQLLKAQQELALLQRKLILQPQQQPKQPQQHVDLFSDARAEFREEIREQQKQDLLDNPEPVLGPILSIPPGITIDAATKHKNAILEQLGKHDGGSRRRRSSHRKRKGYRKSKRVRHTRRKQTRRHRHRHRRSRHRR